MTVKELRQLLFNIDNQDAPILIATRAGDFFPVESVEPASYGLPEILLAAGEYDEEFDNRQFNAYLNSEEFKNDESRTREHRIAEARKVLAEYGEE